MIDSIDLHAIPGIDLNVVLAGIDFIYQDADNTTGSGNPSTPIPAGAFHNIIDVHGK